MIKIKIIIMQVVQYPSDWMLGKPRGSIIESPNGYIIKFTINGKQTVKSFSFKYGIDFDEIKEEMLKWRQTKSDELGLTRNRIRYIDKDTIEVELTQDKFMKTDATLIDKVQLYPLQTKVKKTKDGEVYYVYYQDKKRCESFTNLITNYKTVDYINGDTLDLRLCNLKEKGSVAKIIDVDNSLIDNQYNYFNMDFDQLPKNIWLLGKPHGTIFKRSGQNIWTVVVSDDNTKHTKTFNIESYDSEILVYNAAKKWQITTSYKLDLTKNLIKIIDDNTIEVKLTQNQITTLDKCMIPLVQSIPLFTALSGNKIISCSTVLNSKNIQLHNLIMESDIVNHINHNTLDNRFLNLRFYDHSLNSDEEINNDTTGVAHITDRFGEAYRARIKLHGSEITKSFYIKKNGKEIAKKMAIDFRRKALEINQDNDNVILSTYDDDRLFKYLVDRISEIIDLYVDKISLDKDSYLSVINIDKKYKEDIYKKYIDITLDRISNLNKKVKKIRNIMHEKINHFFDS